MAVTAKQWQTTKEEDSKPFTALYSVVKCHRHVPTIKLPRKCFNFFFFLFVLFVNTDVGSLSERGH